MDVAALSGVLDPVPVPAVRRGPRIETVPAAGGAAGRWGHGRG